MTGLWSHFFSKGQALGTWGDCLSAGVAGVEPPTQAGCKLTPSSAWGHFCTHLPSPFTRTSACPRTVGRDGDRLC